MFLFDNRCRMQQAFLVLVCWGLLMPAAAMADQVIAKVNGQPVTESELEAFTQKVPEPFKAAFKKKALQQIIDARVFYSLGVKAGLLKTEEYKEKIAKAQQMIVTDLFMEKNLKPRITITDKQVADFYRENKARFSTPKKIIPGHIVVKDKDTAVALRKKITPANFDDIAAGLAQTHPEARFFKLGWTEIGKTRMPQAFEEAAAALEKGQISPVVETAIGYHIIKVYDVQPAQEKSFSEVKDKIKENLIQTQLHRLKQEYIDTANVEILAREYQ